MTNSIQDLRDPSAVMIPDMGLGSREQSMPARDCSAAKRDSNSSAYCSAKALACLQAAVRIPGGIQRAALERSAAGWSMRAEQFHRRESRAAAQRLSVDSSEPLERGED